jgi:surface glycoprotein (TIGR04207 family)
MTRTNTGAVRAVALAALMVLSVFASTVAFAGGAAATASGPATVSAAGADVGQLAADDRRVAQSMEENTAANDSLRITTPTTQQTVRSDGLLDVTFEFTSDAPANPQSTTVSLVGPETYTYEVDVSSYAVGAEQSVTLDLDKAAPELADGSYAVEVAVENETGDVETASTGEIVVVNDDAPAVSNVSLGRTADVDPTGSLEVTYDYESSLNASSVTVWVVDVDDVEEFETDPRNATYTTYKTKVDHATGTSRNVTVDLDGRIADNDDYRVFVTATDTSGQRSSPASAPSVLDVNADSPTISSAGTTP